MGQHTGLPTELQPVGALPAAEQESVLRLRASTDEHWAEAAVKWIAVMVGAAVLTLAGCSRAHYRWRADRDAHHWLERTSLDTCEPCGDYSIEVPPASRMFDPFDPDRPPMPPDDPAAHQYMQRVAGMRGSKRWLKDGAAARVESDYWQWMLPVNDENEVLLNADSSVMLALLHSREYQRELEDLYLSALDVSLEKFQFDTQFFGGYLVDYETLGHDRFVPGGDSQTNLTTSTVSSGQRDISAEKVFATGGDVVIGLANSLMWQFSGPDTHSALTVLDFAVVQPFLRGAGRRVVLEELTQTQRELLYNIRQMERFRRAFYLQVMAGRNPGSGPGRALRVLGGGSFSTSGAGAVNGYLGLAQDRQIIRNREANIAALRSSLAQLEALEQAGRIDFFQVELVRQELLEQQSVLLRSVTNYERREDDFKIELGLPPQLEVSVDDDIVDQFNLIDEKIVPLSNQLTALQQEAGDAIIRMLPPAEDFAAARAAAAGQPPGIVWDDALARQLRLLQEMLPRIEAIREQVTRENVPRARSDIERLEKVLPQRREEMLRLQEKLADRLAEQAAEAGNEAHQSDDDYSAPFASDLERLEQMPGELNRLLPVLETRFGKHKATLDQMAADVDALLDAGPTLAPNELYLRLRDKVFGPLPVELTDLSTDVLELTLLQARARTESITLSPIDIPAETALEVARQNRRDWMNARGNLVDTWREICLAGNDLQSNLNVIFEGDVRNKGDNPLRLRSSTGRLRVRAEFDAALTRLAERNVYRETLIRYQQARRDYMLFEDSVALVLRDIIRNIEFSQLNFELRRAAVHVAISQVELTQLKLQEPRKPAQGLEDRFGATTARDLVTALGRLLGVQNDFLGVWTSYQVLRRALDLDMGTMQLDPQGLWCDPGPIRVPALEEPAEELELIEPGPLLLPPLEDGVSAGNEPTLGLANFFDEREGDPESPPPEEEKTAHSRRESPQMPPEP